MSSKKRQNVDVWSCKRAVNIGGEALIEGVMMRGPDDIAIAVRKPDGQIIVDKKPLKTLAKRNKIFKAPIIRGAVGIFESMVIGIKALMYSADFVDLEEGADEKPSKFDAMLERIFGEKLKDVLMYFSLVLALIAGIGLFMLLPNYLAWLMHFDNKGHGRIYYNLFEGVVRIIIFLGYLILVSRMKDIQRVFEYHGAEHKTIHCYENDEELTVENVKKYSTKHPRCGTAFLFVIMIISIFIFSLVGIGSLLYNFLTRIILIPLVAGISYEIIKFSGRSKSRIVRMFCAPGLALQNLTTREPDESQIEVAIESLKNVIVENKEAEKW